MGLDRAGTGSYRGHRRITRARLIRMVLWLWILLRNRHIQGWYHLSLPLGTVNLLQLTIEISGPFLSSPRKNRRSCGSYSGGGKKSSSLAMHCEQGSLDPLSCRSREAMDLDW